MQFAEGAPRALLLAAFTRYLKAPCLFMVLMKKKKDKG